MADDGLLVECRQWMQSALEALTLCPSAHTSPSLKTGDELLLRLDEAIRGTVRVVPGTPELERRLHEVEAALAAVGTAFSSLDAMVRAAQAIEESRRAR